jgi:hypothetical protein
LKFELVVKPRAHLQVEASMEIFSFFLNFLIVVGGDFLGANHPTKYLVDLFYLKKERWKYKDIIRGGNDRKIKYCQSNSYILMASKKTMHSFTGH